MGSDAVGSAPIKVVMQNSRRKTRYHHAAWTALTNLKVRITPKGNIGPGRGSGCFIESTLLAILDVSLHSCVALSLEDTITMRRRALVYRNS